MLAGFISAQNVTWPTNASRTLSSGFGEFRDGHFHMGIDIKTRGRTGYPVYAIDDGHISRLLTNFRGYGRALYLTTKTGEVAVYGHLSKFNNTLEDVLSNQQEKLRTYLIDIEFQPGEFEVKRGDVIAYTGNTGMSFGPHLHFEYRDEDERPLNPNFHGFDLLDKVSPELFSIAVIPQSPETKINASSLPQVFPLFRDRKGVYNFPDTLNLYGAVSFSIKSIDQIQNVSNKYQFHKAELMLDNEVVYTVSYDSLVYHQAGFERTVKDYRLFRLNEGQFHKLYRRPEHPVLSIHKDEEAGIIEMTPGYHEIQINVYDAAGNKAVARGTAFGSPPVEIVVKEDYQDKSFYVLNVSPRRGSIPLSSVTCYSFTPYGYADSKIEAYQQKNGKGLIITVPRKKLKNRILQIIAVNKMGAFSYPAHWSDSKLPGDYVNTETSYTLQHHEGGLYLQLQTDYFIRGVVSAQLIGTSAPVPVNLTQVQPNVYLSSLIEPAVFESARKIELKYSPPVLPATQPERIVFFDLIPRLAYPGKQATMLSTDRLCSVRSTDNSIFNTTLMWIEKVSNPYPVKSGVRHSAIYYPKPYEIPLKDSVLVGIRYDDNLVNEDFLSIYAYDLKKKKWNYLPSINNVDRRTMITSVRDFRPLAIIQDTRPPRVESSFPANGAHYHYQDVEVLKVYLNDDLSGIDPVEESLIMTIDNDRLYPAYQPLKKMLTCKLDVPLDSGEHILGLKIRDQAGNTMIKRIKFSVN